MMIHTEEEVREISEYEDGIVVFDDLMEYNHNATDAFFARGRHKDLDVYYFP